MKKILASVAAISISLGLIACDQKNKTTNQEQVSEQSLKQLNIGYQKAALKLIVAKKTQAFEQAFPNVKVEWKEFPAGPQTLEALNVGAIDFGYTGDTPVIFALSANKPIDYLGYEINSKSSHDLLVPKNSTIQNLADLKGKRIALTKGSSAHYFVAQVLNKANLSWQDIQPIWLTPADARAALDKGSIDAWAVWDPYASAAALKGDTRVIFDSSQLHSVYSFYLSTPQFLKAHPKDAQKIVDTLNATDEWIKAHPQEAIQILAESTGIDRTVAEKVLSKRPDTVQTYYLNDAVIKDQQKIADLFSELKLIPNPVQINEHVWKKQ
ncbi:aliphatic sulfonate ABC transporter substrate-binding protein [Acinetobacter sp. SWAC5]|uniref:aliphatic sulfonate ABC transporter substrate-binding protein n=1 Tax=Acinetobacter TaxID=469 RepID=UPI000E346BF8|nr:MULTISPECIES: aliphatic sulfonate ABC transporter substrate-binding protein [Acinetobacter]RFS30716.1 aliphatic sulfonate ABC transporter substrate-binding protein [Acinetobacter sp. SWAC5]RKG51296.1 aliphatic sulfonate ABC transporter substrate-binding protein [Acinetobacter cumulans]